MINQATQLPLNPFGPNSANGLTSPNQQEKLKRAAIEFEAIFLQELLKHAHPKNTRGIFGGGMGEEMFMDQLTQERARAMANSGGLGIAQLIEEELTSDLLKQTEKTSDNRGALELNQKLQQQKGLKSYEEHSRSSLSD